MYPRAGRWSGGLRGIPGEGDGAEMHRLAPVGSGGFLQPLSPATIAARATSVDEYRSWVTHDGGRWKGCRQSVVGARYSILFDTRGSRVNFFSFVLLFSRESY